MRSVFPQSCCLIEEAELKNKGLDFGRKVKNSTSICLLKQNKRKPPNNLTGPRSPTFPPLQHLLAVSRPQSTQGRQPHWLQQVTELDREGDKNPSIDYLISQAPNNIPTLHMVLSVLMEVLFQM